MGQGFADETAAINAEMTFDVGLLVFKHGVGLGEGQGRSVIEQGFKRCQKR
jgi:hypothetical protein